MKKADFEGIVAALGETEAFLEGKSLPGLAVHVPRQIDVAAIRKKSGLSQRAFADEIQVSLGTLRNWEQGRRVPDGPARVLLSIIDKKPKIVKETLGEMVPA